MELYSSAQGDISISGKDDSYFLIAVSDGKPAGEATAGKCIIAAEITRDDEGYFGWLVPLRIDDFSYSRKVAEGRTIKIANRGKDINVDYVDTLGICGLGVEFIERYVPIRAGQYRENYMVFFKIAHAISMGHFSESNKMLAINILKPYVENYRSEWLGSVRKVMP